MKCSKCGAENITGVKFCISCGTSMGMFCPNCGTVNSAGAKFCVSCGIQFGVPAMAQSPIPSQPVVVVKTGTPGWVWALIGILAGLLVVGGLIISGIYPIGVASMEQASPPPQSVSEAQEISSETVYCPETGGVILYWNAGFDCANDTGDPGYRLRYGDGFQDLNTGQFDDQASSIRIPPGWSVRLYENVEKNGASRCFNTSVTNFEDFGNFENRDLPINDNVTSIQVFRDGTCGQDLAAGAKPAPMPEEEAPPEGAPGAQAGGCDCDCVRGFFQEFETDDEWYDIDIGGFRDKYLENLYPTGNPMEIAVVLDNTDGMIGTIINDPNLSLEWDFIIRDWNGSEDISEYSTNPSNPNEKPWSCLFNEIDEVECKLVREYGGMEWMGRDSTISITYKPNPQETAICLTFSDKFAGGQGGGPGDSDQPLDCRDPRVSCPDKTNCVQSKETGLFYCEKIKTNNEPPTEAPSDGSSGGSSGSGGSSCGGSICEPPSSP